MRSPFAPAVLAALLLATSASHAQLQTGPADAPWADTICYAEGTSEAYVRMRNAVLPQVLQFNNGPRWPGGQGSPTTITWSLVPDGLSIPNGIGEGTAPSELFDLMDAEFNGQGGRAAWIQRIEQCFQRWSELSGLTFVRRTSGGNDWDDGAVWGAQGNGSRGDIRIGAKPIDGTNGVLAYASFPNSGDMVLDAAENWGSSVNQNRFMRNIVMHEAGHAIGISHVCSSNGVYLMEPFLTTSIDGPYHDDIRAVQRHYGDPHEADDSVGSATALGTLPAFLDVGAIPPPVAGVTPPNSSTLSLDTGFETDWFSFDVSEASDVTITVRPLGTVYDDSDQNPNGSCGSGNSLDSRQVGDPDLRLFDASGANLVASSVGAGPGANEVVSTGLAAGSYTIEVTNDSGGSVQLYDLEIEAVPTGSCNTTASVSSRTGGLNLNTFVASPPVLGTTMTFTAIGPYTNGVVLAFAAQANVTLSNNQVLLIQPGPTFLFSLDLPGMPFGTTTQAVPPDPAFCGFVLYTQVLMTGPTTGGPLYQLTNSQDLTLGQ